MNFQYKIDSSYQDDTLFLFPKGLPPIYIKQFHATNQRNGLFTLKFKHDIHNYSIVSFIKNLETVILDKLKKDSNLPEIVNIIPIITYPNDSQFHITIEAKEVFNIKSLTIKHITIKNGTLSFKLVKLT